MAQSVYPEDLVFSATSDGTYSAQASTFVTQVRMNTAFASRARSTRDLLNYSLICNILPYGAGSPKGTLSIWVTNASFTTSGSGAVSFRGAVDWVQKTASIVNVGGNDSAGNAITPPFDLSVALNGWGAVQLRYIPTSGDGLMYAKIQGVGV